MHVFFAKATLRSRECVCSLPPGREARESRHRLIATRASVQVYQILFSEGVGFCFLFFILKLPSRLDLHPSFCDATTSPVHEAKKKNQSRHHTHTTTAKLLQFSPSKKGKIYSTNCQPIYTKPPHTVSFTCPCQGWRSAPQPWSGSASAKPA